MTEPVHVRLLADPQNIIHGADRHDVAWMLEVAMPEELRTLCGLDLHAEAAYDLLNREPMTCPECRAADAQR